MLCHLLTPWHDAADCWFTGTASDVTIYARTTAGLLVWLRLETDDDV